MEINTNWILNLGQSAANEGFSGAPEETGGMFVSVLESSIRADEARQTETGVTTDMDNAEDADGFAVNERQTVTRETTPFRVDETADTGGAQLPTKSMGDVMTDLGLTEEQIEMLALKLNISVQDLKNLTVAFDPEAALLKTEPGLDAIKNLKVFMTDGSVKNFASLLGLEENGKVLQGDEAINKIAELLNIDKSQAKDFVNGLKMTALEFKTETNRVAQLASGLPGETAGLNDSSIAAGKNGDAKTEKTPLQQTLGLNQSKSPEETGNTTSQQAAGTNNIKSEQEIKTAVTQQSVVVDKSATESLKKEITNSTLNVSKSDDAKNGVNPGLQELADNGENGGMEKQAGDENKQLLQNREPANSKISDTGFRAEVTQANKTATPVSSASGMEISATESAKAKAVTEASAIMRETGLSEKGVEQRVMNQVVEKVQILSFPDRTHAHIKLTPPTLGSVDIKIVMQDGIARASIMVESTLVKQIVEQNLDQLKAALNQQGITVDDLDVSVDHRNAKSFDSESGREGSGNKDSGADYAENVSSENNDPIEHERIRKAARNSIVDLTA